MKKHLEKNAKEISKTLIFGGHSFHPAWDSKGFLSEKYFLELIEHAYEKGIRHFDATIEAEVQVLGKLLKQWKAPSDVSIGCLQAYPITPEPKQQREQLCRWLDLLGTDSLNYLYVFPPANEEQADELNRQKSEGLFQKMGLWLRMPDENINTELYDFVMGVYNPARRELENRFTNLHRENLSVTILESMGGYALLVDQPEEKRKCIAAALLQYALSKPWCDSVSITMRTKQQVSDNVAAFHDFENNKVDLSILEKQNLVYPDNYRTWEGNFQAFSSPWNGKFGKARC